MRMLLWLMLYPVRCSRVNDFGINAGGFYIERSRALPEGCRRRAIPLPEG